MKKTKLFILFNFREGPWGGANQFLHILSQELTARSTLEEHPNSNCATLVNCNPQPLRQLLLWLLQIFIAMVQAPRAPILLRIDGPVKDTRGCDEYIDLLFCDLAQKLSDQCIFQSKWSLQRMLDLGFPPEIPYAVISNATDPALFYPLPNPKTILPNAPLKIVSTSWSANARKGLASYTWCDAHLSTDAFSLTLIGNFKSDFKNATVVPPLGQAELSKRLKTYDVFFAPSLFESCSNAVIEALQSGLPVIARKGTSSEELVGEGGLFFERDEELPQLFNTIKQQYSVFAANIKHPVLSDVVDSYESAASAALAYAHKRSTLSIAMRLFYPIIFASKLVFYRLFQRKRDCTV